MLVPDWLVPIFQQFPIATLAFAVMALGVRWLNSRHKEELERTQEVHRLALSRADEEIERLRADMSAAADRHAAELDRVTDVYKKQIATLNKRVRQLEQKSEGEGES